MQESRQFVDARRLGSLLYRAARDRGSDGRLYLWPIIHPLQCEAARRATTIGFTLRAVGDQIWRGSFYVLACRQWWNQHAGIRQLPETGRARRARPLFGDTQTSDATARSVRARQS